MVETKTSSTKPQLTIVTGSGSQGGWSKAEITGALESQSLRQATTDVYVCPTARCVGPLLYVTDKRRGLLYVDFLADFRGAFHDIRGDSRFNECLDSGQLHRVAVVDRASEQVCAIILCEVSKPSTGRSQKK